MSDYLPPGADSDPTAPFNDSPAPQCRGCENRIHRSEDHAEGCRDSGLSGNELLARREEDAKHEAAERRRTEQKLSESDSGGL